MSTIDEMLKEYENQYGVFVMTPTDLREFAEKIEAAEREACAKLVEADGLARGDEGLVLIKAAGRIRARGEKPPVKTYAGGKPNYCTPELDLEAPLTVNGVPLYPKKEWVGLTDEELKKIAKKHKWHGGNVEPHLMPVFRSLEAKLKEKNGG